MTVASIVHGPRNRAAWARSVLLVSAFAGALAGCVKSPQIPSWLVLDHKRALRRDAADDFFEPRLLRELGRDTYLPSDTSSEQLAALAINELDHGHVWDAAVLLALAGHRRHEQVRYMAGTGSQRRLVAIFRRGFTEASEDRLESQMEELKEAETKAYEGAVYDGELERIGALVGAPLSRSSQADDLMRIAIGGLHSRHVAAEAFSHRVAALAEPFTPDVRHPAIAEALLAKLIRDAATPETHGPAIRYLASVPLPAYREAALNHVRWPFAGDVVRSGMWLYRSNPIAISDAFTLGQPATQIHAAVILGLSGNLKHLDLLEGRLGYEKDDFVRGAVKFALVCLGEHQHVEELLRMTEAASELKVLLASALLQWLPLDVRLELPTDALTAVINRGSIRRDTQFVTAMNLVDLGTKVALDQDSFRAIGAAVMALNQETDKSMAWRLTEHIGDLEQLSRAYVLEQLTKARRGRDVWLSLLRQHAQEEDLGLLKRAMERSSERSTRTWIVRATAAIPGIPAQLVLQDWFAKDPSQRDLIAAVLILRDDTDKTLLHDLVEAMDDAPTTALLALTLRRPEASAMTASFLNSDEPQERFAAISAVRFLSETAFEEDLWKSANYYDKGYYPGDVRVRAASLSALLHMRLNSSVGGEAEAGTSAVTTRNLPRSRPAAPKPGP